jgi:hypothetical protein
MPADQIACLEVSHAAGCRVSSCKCNAAVCELHWGDEGTVQAKDSCLCGHATSNNIGGTITSMKMSQHQEQLG